MKEAKYKCKNSNEGGQVRDSKYRNTVEGRNEYEGKCMKICVKRRV